MKKILYILIVSLFLTQVVLSRDLKLKGTYWLSIETKWDTKHYNKEKLRLGSAPGQIIYFGDNNRFYCIVGLLDLMEGYIVEISEYDDTTFGFYGGWKKNGDIIELKYNLFTNKNCRVPNRGMSEEYLNELKRLEKVNLKILNNRFKTKIIKRSLKEWQFFNEKELGLEVYDPIISNYFGKEHTVKTKKDHGIKKALKVKAKNFGFCLSPDSKLMLIANDVGENLIRFEIFDRSNPRKIKKKATFKYTFVNNQIKEPKRVLWKDNEIILEYNKKRIKLYINENLVEINNFTIYKKRYLDYLYIQLDQLFENLTSTESEEYFKYFMPFLGLRLNVDFFISPEEIKMKTWERIGYCFYNLIKNLEFKYQDKLVFLIFKRAFSEHFKIENDTVVLFW